MKNDIANNASAPLETLSGSIERVTFHSEETGFCVLKAKVSGQRDLVTVVGNAPNVTAGEYIEATGFWFNDKNYGLQFKATELHSVLPTTLAGMEKYLGSGMVKGVGPFFAEKLVKAFGDKVFEIIEYTPNELHQIPGIGQKRIQMITSSWKEQKVIRDIMVFLQSHGVGTARAVRIYKTYGDKSIAMVRENPYRLALDIHGIGFKTADTIAMRLGVAKDSLLRAQAGIRNVLQEFSQSGHCAAFAEVLQKKAAELLEIPESIIIEAITAELANKNIILEQIDGKDALYLSTLFNAEKSVAHHIKRLRCGIIPWGKFEIEKAIGWVENKTNLQLSNSQKDAVHEALCNKVMIITGGPGVGKTTIVNSIIKIITAKKINILLCAPTGRAAKRLSETTNMPAKTIHRLLEFDPQSLTFIRNSDNPLAADLVIVDEVSMLDVVLMNSLLKAIPTEAALLMVGDVDQLPSVGPGTVLADLIQSQTIATVFLIEIFRQAANSQIIINSHRINQGEMPMANDLDKDTDFYMVPATENEEIHDKLLHIVSKRIPERFGFNAFHDIQVLSPMNRGGIGTRALNVSLQKLLNGQSEPKVTRFGWTFAPGDKIIQNINNYDKEVFNGDIGNITSVDLDEGYLLVDFDKRLVRYEFAELDEVALAYAISIHKSQGSEYPVVVIPLSTQHYVMLARNLIYTGVTRGKKLVIIIGQPKALAMAVKNAKHNQRLTNLQARLKAI
jgi:exodeoxyribonuclease V alpha subunit